MFNLEGLIPKLCQLAQEFGDDERALRLRSAGLEALAFMVQSVSCLIFSSLSIATITCVYVSINIQF